MCCGRKRAISTSLLTWDDTWLNTNGRLKGNFPLAFTYQHHWMISHSGSGGEQSKNILKQGLKKMSLISEKGAVISWHFKSEKVFCGIKPEGCIELTERGPCFLEKPKCAVQNFLKPPLNLLSSVLHSWNTSMDFRSFSKPLIIHLMADDWYILSDSTFSYMVRWAYTKICIV